MTDTCGCCDGIRKLTPESTANRPGLDSIEYRVGTHATFFATMIAGLTGQVIEIPPVDDTVEPIKLLPLAGLTSRERDDPAIALLDAWATVADVLTFYQERIANEGYLRTAIERRSALELAALVGYRPRPGVAASVHLAFSMEKDQVGEVPAGTGARSIPGPGEQAQTFETSHRIDARAEWNELKPRQTRPPYITSLPGPDKTLYFEGIATSLEPNDRLLLHFDTPTAVTRIPCKVNSVEAQPEANRTAVTLQSEDGSKQSATTAAETWAFPEKLHNALNRELRRPIDAEYPLFVKVSRVAGGTAAEVTELLLDLLESLPAPGLPVGEHDMQRLEAHFEQTMASVEGKAKGLSPRATNLKKWLPQVTRSLRESISIARDSGFASGEMALPGAPSALTPEEAAGGVLVDPGRLLGSLMKPPSLPPAGPLQLPRDSDVTFGLQKDIVPRLLLDLRPGLDKVLYAALSNVRAEATEDGLLRCVEAFRVKAAPFGHNAPMKPIYDDKGIVVGHEEWPLESETLVVRLESGVTGSTVRELLIPSQLPGSPIPSPSVAVSVSATRDGRTSHDCRDLSGVTVNSSYDAPNTGAAIGLAVGTSFEVMVDWAECSIMIKANSSHVAVDVDEEVYELSKGERWKATDPVDMRDVTVSYSESGETLLVAVEAPVTSNPESYPLVLDAEYEAILPQSRITFEPPNSNSGSQGGREVLSVRTVTKSAYGMTARVTELEIQGNWPAPEATSLADVRETTVFAGSENLTLAEEPIETDVSGRAIELDGLYDGLEPGQWLIVSGERADIDGTSGVEASELVMLAGLVNRRHQLALAGDAGEHQQSKPVEHPDDTLHTVLQLSADLAYAYKRETVTIYGNVAHATHGETRREVLGSGDGGQGHQRFELKQAPLTCTAAPTAAGADSTLDVFVNDVQWHEADSMAGVESTDRSFVTKTDNEDKTSLVFGDGKRGARLPTGAENIAAVYRNGIGNAGNVDEGQISVLSARPLGTKEVVNPIPATGGANRDSRDTIRRNAPLAIAVLDRLVSVQDYADFALAFAGIAKASAVRLSDGQRRLLHLTIAGVDDVPIAPGSDLHLNLCQALRRRGDPSLQLRIDSREAMRLVIAAGVNIEPDYRWEFVEPKIRAALVEAHGFDSMELGQDVLRSEVLTTIHQVDGVSYVDVDKFDALDEGVVIGALGLGAETGGDDGGEAPGTGIAVVGGSLSASIGRKSRVKAQLGRIDTKPPVPPDPVLPAQLIWLSPEVPETLILSELTP